ncbi:MAG: NAD(P)/FAD-dependent oxidoreductase [Chloroflexi bacterium]|nr:NAD(P)/FAD-dependent oxidoreductase [Chloroflexota bacterium]
MKVGIVGAGAAGLAAAYDLSNAGHQVVIYESAPFIGGQASTIPVGGHPLERGYHHLFTNDKAILDLMEELGIGDAMEWYPSNVGTYVDGGLHKTTTAFDLLRFSAIPIWERIRMGLFTLRVQRIKDWESLEPYTADHWLSEKLGGQAYDVLWNPLLRGKFGRFYGEVGMPWFWSKIQTRFASREGLLAKEVLGYPTGSFDVVFDALAAEIRASGGEVRMENPVTEIAPKNEAGSVGIKYVDAGREQIECFDCVLSTVPSFIMPSLMPAMPDGYLRRLESVQYLAAVVVILELEHKLTDFYWMNIASDDVPFLGIIEHTNMLPKEWYNDRHVVYLTNYLHRNDELFKLPSDELTDLYLSHLPKFNAGFHRSWVKDVHYNAVSAAQPIIGTEYGAKKPSHRTPFERVYLANTTQIYPEDRGTNYSIRMGREVAEMMLTDATAGWSDWRSN